MADLPAVDWNGPYDDVEWTTSELDQIGLWAYSDVEGVEIDELGEGDEVAGHGVNTPEEQQ